MVSIMRLDGACLGRPTTSAELSTLGHHHPHRLAQALWRSPTRYRAAYYQLANHSAAVLSGSVVSARYAATFYGAATCLIQGNDAVCFEFLTSKCTALPDLMNNPIAFDAQPAEPLIPARFAQPCQP